MSIRTKRESSDERRDRKKNRPESPIDAGPGTRLQKVLAAAGIGSRRRCEELIEEGRVTVNGRVVNVLPAWVDPTEDVIAVEGLELPRPERLVYVMLYKPRATVSTLLDPDGRRTVADLVQHPSGARIYPVGRLDYDTMGMLLLTNDGELANRLTHARYGISKTYRALVKGTLTEESVKQLEARLHEHERRMTRTPRAPRTPHRAAPGALTPAPTPGTGVTLTLVKSKEGKSVIDIAITEGKARPVKDMLEFLGLMVKKIVRVRLGPLRLTGVALGEWRELSREELRDARIACGLARAERPTAAAKSAKPGTIKRSKPRVDDDGFSLILPNDPALAPQVLADDELDGDSVW
jgi:23S rRNA pseudouridine2605 synthase